MGSIGAKIKSLRKQAGISQKELAKTAGIAASTLCDIENLTKNPSSETLRMLSGALGIKLSDLIDEDKQVAPGGLKAEEIKLIDDYRQLNEQGKEYIRQTMFMAVSIYKKHACTPDVEKIV